MYLMELNILPVFLLVIIRNELSYGREEAQSGIPVEYAVLGKPFRLVFNKNDGRSISFCRWSLENKQSFQINRTEGYSEAALKAGECAVPIKKASGEHFTIWRCDGVYSTNENGGDLSFRYQVKVQKAKKPALPVIEPKIVSVITFPLNDVSQQNNTVPEILCCTKGGLPAPQLMITFDNETKAEGQNARSSDFCIKWPNASFSIYDDRKPVLCQSSHITGLSEADLRINALHAPIIMDENQIEKSIITHIYKPEDKTVLQVNFKSNPKASVDWKIYDIYSQKPENLDQWPNHEKSLNFNEELNIWTARLVIQTNHINSQNNYSLELINEYGNYSIPFEVVQIVHYPKNLAEYSTIQQLNFTSDENGIGQINISCCQIIGEVNENVTITLQLENNGETEILGQGTLRNDSTENLFCINWKNLEVSSEGTLKCKSENLDDFGLRLPYRKQIRREVQLHSQYKPNLTDPKLTRDKFGSYSIDVDISKVPILEIKFDSFPKAEAETYISIAENLNSKNFLYVSYPSVFRLEQNDTEKHGVMKMNLEELETYQQSKLVTVFKVVLKNEIGKTYFIINVQNYITPPQLLTLETTTIPHTSENNSSTISVTTTLSLTSVAIEENQDKTVTISSSNPIASSQTSSNPTTTMPSTEMPKLITTVRTRSTNPTQTFPTPTTVTPHLSLTTMMPNSNSSTTVDHSNNNHYNTSTVFSYFISESTPSVEEVSQNTVTRLTFHSPEIPLFTTELPEVNTVVGESELDYIATKEPKFYKENPVQRLEARITVSMTEFKTFKCCIKDTSISSLVISSDDQIISAKDITKTATGKTLCAISRPMNITRNEHNSKLKCTSSGLKNNETHNLTETLEIRVKGKPIIMNKSHEASITGFLNEPIVLSVRYFSNPPAKHTWLVKVPHTNFSVIEDDDEYFNVTTIQIKDNIMETFLTINYGTNNTLHEYVRTYFKLRLSNDYGESDHEFYIEPKKTLGDAYNEYSAYQSPVVISVIGLLLVTVLALTGVYLAKRNAVLCFKHRSKVIYISNS